MKMKMETYLSVELGRTNIAGHSVAAEFGRAKDPERAARELSVNSAIELDTQLTEALTFSAPIYVNGRLAAKGHPKFDKEHHFIVVDEIIDETSHALSLTKGQMIALDTDNTRAPGVLDVTVNDRLTAKGEIVKGIADSRCYIRITEVAH